MMCIWSFFANTVLRWILAQSVSDFWNATYARRIFARRNIFPFKKPRVFLFIYASKIIFFLLWIFSFISLKLKIISCVRLKSNSNSGDRFRLGVCAVFDHRSLFDNFRFATKKKHKKYYWEFYETISKRIFLCLVLWLRVDYNIFGGFSN